MFGWVRDGPDLVRFGPGLGLVLSLVLGLMGWGVNRMAQSDLFLFLLFPNY